MRGVQALCFEPWRPVDTAQLETLIRIVGLGLTSAATKMRPDLGWAISTGLG